MRYLLNCREYRRLGVGEVLSVFVLFDMGTAMSRNPGPQPHEEEQSLPPGQCEY